MNGRRALFLTPINPSDMLTAGSGVQRRFAMLVDAVCAVADHVDFVVMTDAWRARELEQHARESTAVLRSLTGVPLSLTLVPIAPPGDAAGLFERYGLGSTSLFRLPAYRPYVGAAQLAAVDAVLEREPDFVFVQKLCCAAILLRLRARRALPAVFFDLDDIEHRAYRRIIELPPVWHSKRLAYLHIPALMAGEHGALRLARRTFVCSEPDRRRLCRTFLTRKVTAIPNAIEAPATVSPPARAPRVLLLGVYTYAPNRAAAEYFLDEIWPRIRTAIPQATAVIAGARPQAVRHSADPPPGTEFPGFVEDLDGLYADTTIVVCPIRAGGGTRVKIIEAAAYARPVVSTHLGAEGLEFRDGSEIVLRDDSAGFAAACIDLLRDPAACRTIGDAARERAQALYGRSTIAARVAHVLRSELDAAAGHGAARPASERD